MIFNLDDAVKVKLTSRGELVLAQYRIREHEKLQARYDRDFAGRASATTFPAREARQLRAEELERQLLCVWKSHAEDADGYRSFRFRKLVSIFGGEFVDESNGKLFENDEIVFGVTEDSL